MPNKYEWQRLLLQRKFPACLQGRIGEAGAYLKFFKLI